MRVEIDIMDDEGNSSEWDFSTDATFSEAKPIDEAVQNILKKFPAK